MKITFFHWAYGDDSSIKRSFMPLIRELRKGYVVYEYSVPYIGSNPIHVVKNILFVYRKRSGNGVNHITGDIHYCIIGLLGVKSVLTIHDDFAFTTAKKGVFDRLYKWIFWLYLPIKLANKVLCISPTTKEAIDGLVKNNKTEVFPQHSLSENYTYSEDRKMKSSSIILQVGTLPQKNLETTLKALRNSTYELHVIRKMTCQQMQLAKELNVHVCNKYDLSDEQIVDEYKKADILVFPSLQEGFGMPIIEAQAVGCPVITSNRCPMSWVADEGALLLNDPLDEYELKACIEKVLYNLDFRNYLVQSGLRNIERFTLKNVVDRFIKLYQSL